MQLKEFSDIAADFLTSADCCAVHSVYKNTVNLSCGKEMISIQPESGIRTPLSVLTDCSDLSSLNVKRDDPVQISHSGLVLAGRYHLEFDSSAVPYSTRLQMSASVSVRHIQQGAETILDTLAAAAPPESIYHSIECSSVPAGGRLYLAEQHKILKKAEEAGVFTHPIPAAEALSDLIGLGPGLTPAGDDFIIGVLSVLHFLSASEALLALQKCILPSLSATTDISGRFLYHACSGHFSLPMIQLFDGIASGNNQQISASCQQMISIGHSSGCDTLAGALWALEQNRNN